MQKCDFCKTRDAIAKVISGRYTGRLGCHKCLIINNWVSDVEFLDKEVTNIGK